MKTEVLVRQKDNRLLQVLGILVFLVLVLIVLFFGLKELNRPQVDSTMPADSEEVTAEEIDTLEKELEAIEQEEASYSFPEVELD